MKRILGLLGWLGVVLVLAAVVTRFVKPELVEVYQGLAIAGLVTTLLYTLSQWRDIARSMSGRGAKYGSMTAGSVILMLVILVAINYIGNRQTKRWDLTGAGQFTLSDQSKKILASLTQPLTVRVYYQTGAVNQVRDKLEGYTQASSKMVTDYIDAEKNPARAQTVARVEAWTRARFTLAPEVVVSVAELACQVPGCPPIEVVIAFWEGETR